MDRALFISRGLALKALQEAFVLAYLGLSRGFGWLDAHPLRRR